MVRRVRGGVSLRGRRHEGDRVGEKEIAVIQPSLCKGCGGCVPVCASEAIDLEGYTNAQVTAMIDALAVEAA